MPPPQAPWYQDPRDHGQSARALRSTAPRTSANLRAAIRAVRASDPELKLVLVTLPDIRNLPESAGPIREGRIPGPVADAYTEAIRGYNAEMRSLAASDPRTALLDLDLAMRLASRSGRGYVVVAGRKVDRLRPGNGLDHLFLADRRHTGTLGQGLVAQMLIETIDAKFAAGIEPLGGPELLGFAVSPPAVSPAETAGELVVRGVAAP